MKWLAAVGVLFIAACGDGILCDLCRGRGALLAVSPSAPDVLLDSAQVGTTTPQVSPVQISNEGDGELHWAARVKHASPWLSLQPDTGTAGVTPTLQVVADPSGLAVGVYKDTVIVEDRGGSGSLDVPVEFRITP